jgi:glyoxylase-like metal-dependent hydrolase (beta-lactamase superfamily II)
MGIPFVRDIEFNYGRVDRVSPMIRRVIARNPGPFTYTGTGVYIIGQGQVAVIDPGPLIDEHVEALLKALGGETVSHILVTHTHNDHSPAAAPLKAATGAKTYAYGPHGSGIEEGPKVEEGGDMAFRPDVEIRHGDMIEGASWTIECVHTPGHTSNHMCFALREEKALFTGDHVMGWSTSVIAPPDGNMKAYMRSLRLLLDRDDEIFWPTHGPPITDPKPFVEAFIRHREAREAQIMQCLDQGITTIPDMVARMYQDVDRRLHPAAARSVLAHMIHMVDAGHVRTADGRPPALGSRYESV